MTCVAGAKLVRHRAFTSSTVPPGLATTVVAVIHSVPGARPTLVDEVQATAALQRGDHQAAVSRVRACNGHA
jgi:hypothetical protein